MSFPLMAKLLVHLSVFGRLYPWHRRRIFEQRWQTGNSRSHLTRCCLQVPHELGACSLIVGCIG